MVSIFVPKETSAFELRVALVTSVLQKMRKINIEILIESGAGIGSNITNDMYESLGAKIVDRKTGYEQSSIVIRVQPPSIEEISEMKNECILISMIFPSINHDIVASLKEKNIRTFAMDMIPRISRAQDMDVLSSQATVVGYKAVLIAANTSNFFFPMLTTAAGSIKPAKVLIIGVGVAGLQAIATAKRLGAIVEAYDVRPETKEQVESLGAKFVDTGISAIGTGGYSRELTKEEIEVQSMALTNRISSNNVVICLAGIFGKKAPIIIKKHMIESMKNGSIIVDAMSDSGGNCELSKHGESIYVSGVHIIAPSNISSMLSSNASEMYSKNVLNFLNLLIKDGNLSIDMTDDIITKSLIH